MVEIPPVSELAVDPVTFDAADVASELAVDDVVCTTVDPDTVTDDDLAMVLCVLVPELAVDPSTAEDDEPLLFSIVVELLPSPELAVETVTFDADTEDPDDVAEDWTVLLCADVYATFVPEVVASELTEDAVVSTTVDSDTVKLDTVEPDAVEPDAVEPDVDNADVKLV